VSYNRSTFPEQIDSLPELLSLSADQYVNAERYRTLLVKTNKTPDEIIELNQLSITLKNYIIDPETWNKFSDICIGLETFFSSEVQGYIDTKQIAFDSTITEKTNLFDVKLNRFTFLDEYNPITQYRIWNTLSYQGESYLCILDSLGNLPTNTTYFKKIAQRGAQGEVGASGTGLRFKGAWSGSTSYLVDDGIQYLGAYFGCLQDNIGQEPNPNQATAYWALAVGKGQSTGTVELKNVVTVSNITSNIPIGIPEYNHLTDSLTVIKNTTVLTEGVTEDYVINANGISIDNVDGLLDGTVTPIKFEFKVFKNYVLDLTFSDGNMIQNDTIGDEKLKPDNKIGSIATLTTTDKSSVVNAINETSIKISGLLENYNTYSSNIDSNGIFTIVDYKRSDTTLHLNSTLSGGTSPNYVTDTWTYYELDGTTVSSTLVWTLGYDSNGNLISRTHP